MSIIAAVPLANAWIELEPLSSAHLGDLEAAVSEPDELFRWVSAWRPGPDGLAGALDRALAMAAHGDLAPWVIRRRADGRVVGATSYLDIDAGNRRVEVGATWIGPRGGAPRSTPRRNCWSSGTRSRRWAWSGWR